jgi:hypothetical protein
MNARLRFYHFRGPRVESLAGFECRIKSVKKRAKLVSQCQLFFETGIWNVGFYDGSNVRFSIHPPIVPDASPPATKAECHNFNFELLIDMKSLEPWGVPLLATLPKKVGHRAAQNLDASLKC